MERKVRVLRIINRFNLGGPTYNAAYLSKYLSDEYETLLVGGVKDVDEDSSEFMLEKLDLKPILIEEMKRPINFKEDRKAYKKLVKLINEFKPDIVHTHASKAGLLGRLAAFKCNVPVVVHTFHGHVFHSYFGRVKTSLFKSIERYLASKSSKIIAISAEQKRELSEDHKIAPKSKFEIIPLGFDLSRFQENMDSKRIDFRTKYNLKENEIAVGIIGRLAPIKNHHFFLDVAKNILEKEHTSHVKFFIIGDGETMVELQSYCKELNLAFDFPSSNNFKSNIIFTSWIKDIDIALAGLDIVTLTSKNEGTPVSLIEAQAANKPIVTTNVGGIKDIIIENKTAYLCPQENISDFVTKLSKLIDQNEIRENMSVKGWDNVKSKFHYTRLVLDIENLYSTLLNKNLNINK